MTPLNFPLDIFFEISLHLPHTKDVISLSLVNRNIRATLLTPALFKSRLLLQGWDVSAWQDEDDKTPNLGDSKRWLNIDYTYCRTMQLFEEAAAKNHFVFFSDGLTGISPADRSNNSPGPHPILDGQKTVIWLRKLSEVLPTFVTHHRANNIARITKPKHYDALRAYARVVTELSCFVPPTRPQTITLPVLLIPSDFAWFERACFGLVALVMQCDATTLKSIFEESRTAMDSPMMAFEAFWRLENRAMALFSNRKDFTPHRISERYFVGSLIQTFMSTHQHFSLSAPSLPHFDGLSYYEVPFELGPTSSVRPWLQGGLAGTPLARLSSTTGRSWLGYYSVVGVTGRDPPMSIEMRSAKPPPDAEDDHIYFRGEGTDNVGPFSLRGSCDTKTGLVIATKAYVNSHQWEWRGMLTPFGIVGMWGAQWYGGWWWIWPREWSPEKV
ncbi:hypothetical protein B0F90DRAFT_1787663 [Multifurca ochricompacta]|uniref:F-box domain-containing protein n=1 Tax=Multifurca ochricompacta TaxID=376703 RepID=A0AAD4LTE2_9AGAM|nr:hypothetical protein B0F90DRAFT_1787663 [Multifurca ochricompacta]